MKAWAGALLLLAGCLSPSGEDIPPGDLALSEPTVVLGARARETDIVQSDLRTLFLAGYSAGPYVFPNTPSFFIPSAAPGFLTEPPRLWRSDDAGASWARVDVGDPAEGAIGNSDVDLAYAGGVLYVASMSFSRVGHSIAVGASDDDGATWTWNVLSAQAGVDRPWVAVAPDGTAHAIWNDGVGVHHARSTDRGRTWTETTPAAERGGSGSLAVSPAGALVARIIPVSGSSYTRWEGEGTDGVAISEDGGASWTFRPLPGEREYFAFFDEPAEDATFRWCDPVAFDSAGTLYAAWPEEDAILLARSGDLGATWDVAIIVSSPGTRPHFPALFGRAPGELAMTWYELGDEIVARVAVVTGADSASPIVRAAAFNTVHAGQTGGEYFGATFLREGGLGVSMTRHGAGGSDADKGFDYRVAR